MDTNKAIPKITIRSTQMNKFKIRFGLTELSNAAIKHKIDVICLKVIAQMKFKIC